MRPGMPGRPAAHTVPGSDRLIFSEGAMQLVNTIRDAHTEQAIYYLLTSYIDAVRSCDKLRYMPDALSTLPLAGNGDLQTRFENLLGELDKASKRLDDQACVVIKEALAVFSAALNRLWSIEKLQQALPAGVNRQSALSWSCAPLNL
jgi:hypothetical protein